MLKRILNLADLFYKLANNYPNGTTITGIIERVINDLPGQNSAIMHGVRGVSNVELQSNIEYHHVSFLLIVDQTAQANQYNRQEIIKSAVTNALKQAFPGFEFHIDYTDFPE